MNVSTENVSAEPDHLLVQRITNQDADALTILYNRYHKMVFGLALRIVNNTVIAEEIIQDVFLKVWRDASQWQGKRGPVQPWLLGIVRYTAIDHLRHEHRRPEVVLRPIEEFETVIGTQALVDDINWQNGRTLKRMLAQLPREQAQVIEIVFFQGYTHVQAAELLDMPLGTLKTRLRLGLQKLKGMWLLTADSGQYAVPNMN